MKLSAHFLIVWLLTVAAVPEKPRCGEFSNLTSVASDPSGAKSASPKAAGKSGIVEGIVRYQPDSKRPWKFSRYYIQNPKDGFLAEAVVALEGFAGTPPDRPESPKDHAMDQVNFQFAPETMAIRAGDSVRITNSDDALHNVMTSDGGKPFNVNVIKGKEFRHTFERPGGLNEPIRLGCVFHGGMRAWIYVFDHPWFKVTERDGRFRFENVPAGFYTLKVVHPAGKLGWIQRVEVKPDTRTPVEVPLSPDSLIGSKRNGG